MRLCGQTPVGKIVRLDPALDALVPKDAKLEKVRGDFRFIEGPLWVKNGNYLLFSDLMQNAIFKWTPGGGPGGNVEVFRKPVYMGTFPDGVMIGTNGLALDPQGRLIAAEHGNHRISRTEKDGTITTLADRYEGKRLNSPNDVVVKKSGDIYFTDPVGLLRTYPENSEKPVMEMGFNGLFRITTTGKVELLAKDIQYPNGLAFSPDEKKLYVASSRPDKYWMVYDVNKDGSIANGRKFFDGTKEPGDDVPDGMKVDSKGNIYATGLTGVVIFSPQGKRLGVIEGPEIIANLNWGNADGKTLYMTARTGLYRMRMSVGGARR
jgi:gluconolactonase